MVYIKGICFLPEAIAGHPREAVELCIERLQRGGLRTGILRQGIQDPDDADVLPGDDCGSTGVDDDSVAAEIDVSAASEQQRLLLHGRAGRSNRDCVAELAAWASQHGLHAGEVVVIVRGGCGSGSRGGCGSNSGTCVESAAEASAVSMAASARDVAASPATVAILATRSGAGAAAATGPDLKAAGADAISFSGFEIWTLWRPRFSLPQCVTPAATGLQQCEGHALGGGHALGHTDVTLSGMLLAVGRRQKLAGATLVGYVMKASREQDLAKAGLLGLVPQDGDCVCLMPLDMGLPLARQHPEFLDAVLHKGSDELRYGVDGLPCFSDRMERLKAELAACPHVCVVDPFECTSKVINRLDLCSLTAGLSSLDLNQGLHLHLHHDSDLGRGSVRAPGYFVLNSTDEAHVQEALEHSGLCLPLIIKPVVACGLPDSHRMALVVNDIGLKWAATQVPLPAIAQEYLNHGGLVFKVYVAGDRVFHTVRPSIPDLDPLSPAFSEEGAITFDSLKTLPTQLPAATFRLPAASTQPPLGGSDASLRTVGSIIPLPVEGRGSDPNMGLDLDPVIRDLVAKHLQQQFGLTLFGFDIVIEQPYGQASAGDGQAPMLEEQSRATQRAGDGQVPMPARPTGTAQPLCGQHSAAHGLGGRGGPPRYLVIDVNYFPSYRGATEAPKWFREALRQAVGRHKDKIGGDGNRG